jgi:DNA-binding CsgD family transcriptional regulator
MRANIMKRIVLTFGLISFALLVLFQLSKYSLLTGGWSNEMIISIFALSFLVFGILASRLLLKPRIVHVEPSGEINNEKIVELGLSRREYEVLREIAAGLSNHEIAVKLFIAESTVKTHVSNILIKLDARRRTEAVTKARRLGIL